MPYENDDPRQNVEGTESPHAEFRVNNARVIACLVLALVMCLVCAAMIVGTFLIDLDEPVLNKRIVAILLGGCGIVLALILLVTNWQKYGQQVVVFAEGFRLKKGGQWSIVLWDQIDAVWQYSATIEGARATLETDLWVRVNGGQTFYLTSFLRDMQRLVDIVLGETARRMVPAMWSQIQEGQTVPFGTIKISATGLESHGKELAWEDVADIQVLFGGINVRLKEGNKSWYYTRVKKMPNYHVFLTLSDRLLKDTGNGEPGA
jgi:hypothetical protein